VLKEKKEGGVAEDTGEICPKCKKGKIVKRKGAYGEFYCCNNFPKCKTVFEEDGDKFKIKEKWDKDKKDSKSGGYKKYSKVEKTETESDDSEPSDDEGII